MTPQIGPLCTDKPQSVENKSVIMGVSGVCQGQGVWQWVWQWLTIEILPVVIISIGEMLGAFAI